MITSLKKNILYLALIQGSSYILPLLTFPYLVRVLGVEHFGILAFSQSTIQYFVILTDYGFNWTATQSVAKNKNNEKVLNSLFWSVINAKIALCILSIVILLILIFVVPQYNKLYIVMLSCVPLIIGNVIYPVWFIQGIEKMKFITVSTLSARFLIIPLTFVFVNDSRDLWLAALIQSSVNIFSGLLVINFIIKNKWIGKYEISFYEIKQRLLDGIHVFLSTSSISLYTVSITVILGFVSGPVSVGYFNAANTIRNAFQGLLGPVFQAIFPRVNSLFEVNYNGAISLIRKAIRGVGGVSLVGAIVLFFMSDFIIKHVAGNAFRDSAIVLKWLAFVPFFISLSNIFGVQTMLSHSYKKQFSAIIFSGSIFNIVIIFPLIINYAEVGAAVAVFLTELFVTFTMFVFLRKKKIDIF